MTSETACPVRKDRKHCTCWYDGEGPCCACAEPLPHKYKPAKDGTCADFHGDCAECGRQFNAEIHSQEKGRP